MEHSAHGVPKRLAAEERLPLINFMTSRGKWKCSHFVSGHPPVPGPWSQVRGPPSPIPSQSLSPSLSTALKFKHCPNFTHNLHT